MNFASLDDETVALLITLAIIAAGLGFGLLLVWLTVRQMRGWIQRLGEGLDDARLDWSRGHGKHAGRTYSFTVRSARNGPSTLHVDLAGHSAERITISLERGHHRLFKAQGLVGEIEIGEAGFDTRYLIDATHPAFTRDYLAGKARREAIDALFALGYSEVEIDTGGAHARQRPWRGIDAMPAGLVADTLPLLRRLLESLPLAAPLPATERPPESKDYRAVWVGLALLLIGTVAAFYGGVRYPPVDTFASIGAALVATLALLFPYGRWAWRLNRGATDSHERWIATLLLGILGLGAASWGALTTLNGQLDTSAPTRQELLVIDKARHNSNNATYHEVRLAPWGGRRKPVWVSVDGVDYRKLRPQQNHYALTTRAGALDFEWIVAGEAVIVPH